MNTLANTEIPGMMAAPADWRTRLVDPVFPDNEGELVLTALKLPRKTFYDKVARLGIELQDFR